MTTKTAGDRDPSRFNSAIRQLYAGGSNNTGQVTLTASATSTVVAHQSCNPKSHISLTPITANASLAAAPSFAPTTPLILPIPRLYQFTRVLSVASGNVSYTGLGFKPALLSFYGGVAAGTAFGEIGADDGTRHQYEQMALASTVAVSNTNFAFIAAESGVNFQTFTVASMDSDGFTLAWVKTGTPTLTYLMAALAFPDISSNALSGTTTAGAYISARSIGSFTITHRANAAVDQTFTYSVTGGA